ncbi:MAG: hypothetical protein PHQ19_07695 [Candidatus Krumholzibacteria bacterium]|nr:hypothetical protein [Candidatus Krumholzibacteria bacterium]
MDHSSRALWLVGMVCAVLVVSTGIFADPCLVVYPDCGCVYRYDVTEYYTVGPGDTLYDPLYDRGGLVLLETGTNEIDMSIYQAPMLQGFEPSVDGNEGYIFVDTDFDLIIDGFNYAPTTYLNVLLVFDRFVPEGCVPEITVNGMPLAGFVYPVGDLVVSTPTPDGNNYSDTVTLAVSWRGCYGLHMWAFSDENYNGALDGGECFTAYSHDSMVPAEDSSWGAVKSLYRR